MKNGKIEKMRSFVGSNVSIAAAWVCLAFEGQAVQKKHVVREIQSADTAYAHAARRMVRGGEEQCGDSAETIDQSRNTEDIRTTAIAGLAASSSKASKLSGLWGVEPLINLTAAAADSRSTNLPQLGHRRMFFFPQPPWSLDRPQQLSNSDAWGGEGR